MNKLFLVVVLFFSAFLVGCNSSADPIEGEYAFIPITDPVQQFSVEDLVGDYNLIQLETTDESLLSGIHQIHVMNHKLYITDRRLRGVYIFTDKGEFLAKIKNLGQGPEEYLQVSSFETDPYQNRLLLADNFSKRLFIYDELGNLQKVIPLDFAPMQILSDKSGRFMHLNSTTRNGYSSDTMENTNVHILDANGKVIDCLLPDQTPKRIDIASALTPSYTADGKLLYLPVLGDTIYRVEESGVVPLYVLRSESKFKILSNKEREKAEYIFGKSNTLEEKEKEGCLISWGGFLASDSLVYLEFGWDTPFLVYYSKKRSRSLCLQPDKLKGNVGLRKIFMGDVFALVGNRFYTRVDRLGMYGVLSVLPEGRLKSAFEQIAEDANPCIIDFTLKIDSCLLVLNP